MRRLYQIATNVSWGLLVSLLPITSLPLLSRLMGGTDVAPVSVVFLAILVVIWLLPRLLRGKGLPRQSVPLLVFFLVALVSSFLAFFLPLPSFKNEGLWQNELPNILTLGIGISFYLVISLWISDENKLNLFFRIVNISGAIMLGYTLIQALFVMVFDTIPVPLNQFQMAISASETFFVDRVNGLAFEPSWLAHELNMFYIPIWLGLSIKKLSMHKFRLISVSLENLLLIVSLFVLFLSKSRIGWLAFLAYIAYLVLRLMDIQRLKWSQRLGLAEAGRGQLKKNLFNAGFWGGFTLVFLGVLVSAGWVLTKIDPQRMGELFNFQTIQELGILGWASRLVFAERIVYWIAGFSAFLLYPVFGAGLGNVGFLIPKTMNSFGYKLPEVLRIYLDNTFLPNAKNLWVRILAETGIVGFSVFVAWLWVGWKTARANERSASTMAQAMGITGQIVIVGLVVEGFSLDTFALPYFWMTLGLVVAVYRIFELTRPGAQPDIAVQVTAA